MSWELLASASLVPIAIGTYLFLRSRRRDEEERRRQRRAILLRERLNEPVPIRRRAARAAKTS
jgi:hypothetical protein